MTTNRRGSTIPLVILAIALLSIGLAYSFRRTGAELRTYSDQQATVDASVLAESGISQFLGGMTTPPSSGSLDTVLTLSRGTVALRLRRLRDSSGISGDVYVIIANATSSASTSYGSTVPTAVHSLAQIVRISTNKAPTINIPSAYTSLNGVAHSGHSSYDSGGDRDGHDDAENEGDDEHEGDDGNSGSGTHSDDDGHSNTGGTTMPWLATPHGGFEEDGDGESSKGAPKDLGTDAAAKAAVGIDWDGIANHGTVHADYTYADCSHLPYGSSSMPIVIVTGDCTITGNHEFDGTLIVKGDLNLNHDGSGDPTVKGIAMVGKHLNNTGSPTEDGWIASGLNRLVPGMDQPVGMDHMNGDPHYHEDDDKATSAENRFVSTGSAGALSVVRNAVADNLPTW